MKSSQANARSTSNFMLLSERVTTLHFLAILKSTRMNFSNIDRVFAGSIPQLYQKYLVPLIFEPYAADLSSRVALHQPRRVLEIAAGTGVVTRHLARSLSPEASIVASDLNQPMLDQAAGIETSRRGRMAASRRHAVAI